MTPVANQSKFKAKLLRPANPGGDEAWSFLILPKAASEKLPRRGRTTADVSINGYAFQSTLEPDGQLSHWLRVSAEQSEAAGVDIGDVVKVEIAPVTEEPEPDLPPDLALALAANPDARGEWDSTTTIARLDWIHWIESAKQAKTRTKRINDAREMLASGKGRVCCFDQSGFYSKAFSAPQAAD